MNFLLRLWHARCRRIDLEVLWPTCKDMASDLDHAKAAFAVHAFNDRAWTILGEAEVYRQIENLK